MDHKQYLGNEMYQSLGKLFYAVAMADKSVHIQEVEKLRTFIRKYWLEADAVEDEYGEEAAFQIETVFDWLLEYKKDSKTCFEDFETFYNGHKTLFNPHLKILILDTAHAIANSFSRKNKAELTTLSKIQQLLK